MSVNLYDTTSDKFSVNPSLVLGHLYNQYKEALYLKAISEPKNYAEVRAKVVTDVKLAIVNDIYTNLRSVLCKGQLDGKNLVEFGGTVFVVNYPPSEADSKILSLSIALDKELDDIVNIVCPPFSDILKARMEAKSAADI